MPVSNVSLSWLFIISPLIEDFVLDRLECVQDFHLKERAELQLRARL